MSCLVSALIMDRKLVLTELFRLQVTVLLFLLFYNCLLDKTEL